MKKKTTKVLFKPVSIKKIQNLSWPQARARFPLMKPYGDADGDGMKNYLDCKPFDRRRQGEEHEEKIERFDHGLISEDEVEDYKSFLGPDPRKHKDFKHFSKK